MAADFNERHNALYKHGYFDFNEANRHIALYEQSYFSGGVFSESFIKDDLKNRKAMDNISTFTSRGRQTNEVGIKKNFYIQEYNTAIAHINTILAAVRTHQSWDSMLISRCEKCRDQAYKLLDIVNSY
jgi:hypothetical protein